MKFSLCDLNLAIADLLKVAKLANDYKALGL